MNVFSLRERRRGSQEKRHPQVNRRSHFFFTRTTLPKKPRLHKTNRVQMPSVFFSTSPQFPLQLSCRWEIVSSQRVVLPSLGPFSRPSYTSDLQHFSYLIAMVTHHNFDWASCACGLLRDLVSSVMGRSHVAALFVCPLSRHSPLLVLPPLTCLSMEIM